MTDVAHVGPPFKNDLFISYSHGDDGSGNAHLQPWSAAFAKALEDELRADRRFRKTLRVFLDQDQRPGLGVDPMAPLTEDLQAQITGSAFLVVLMSDDYLESQWCTDERNWWFEHQLELGLAAQRQVVVVKIWPTAKPWPSVLTDSRDHPILGFEFFVTLPSGTSRPLGWVDMPGPFGKEFRMAVLDIVGRLYPKLDALKARLEEVERTKADAARLAQQGGQSLYLHGRADHGDTWEKAALALTDQGFVVVPGDPDPVEQDANKLLAIRERRVTTLTECDALLLVATDDTRALDEDLVVVGKHDRHSARARTQRLLPCGLLDTVGASVATSVRKANARNLQADWIDGTSLPWTPAVQQWLAAKGQRERLP
jgi:hypothetical protein